MSNLITITDAEDGHVRVSWQQETSVPKFYPHQIPFSDPLNDKDRSELRWYLEDYLQYPYGAEDYRAQKVEQQMEEWGAALFRMVFVQDQSGADPRTFYQEAVRLGLNQCDICVSSDHPQFLNIPWELLRDPAHGRGYLAFSLGGLYRRLSSHAVRQRVEAAVDGPFRVLMVIPRAKGDRLSMTMGARHVVEALRPYRDSIELEVLRPPTLDALQEKLSLHPGRYRIVHFDGHGGLVGQTAAGSGLRPESGHLQFETSDGEEDLVPAQVLGTLLANNRVPMFILDACQSAKESSVNPFSSVAAQLVAMGATAVLGNSHSVYGSAAARFIGRLYERLVAHAPLSSAVAAARRSLLAEPRRSSVVGPLALQDWMVPVLHLDQPGYTPIPAQPTLEQAEEELRTTQFLEYVRSVLEEGQYGFIGRDSDLLDIERALRDPRNPVVLITGVAGMGKTSLAYAFGRWYAETGGCPGGVHVTSFQSKADFGQIIGSIVGYGTDFSMLSDDQQFNALAKQLKGNPCLLIWDNFETVAGYPEGAEPFATKEARDKMSRLLRSLRGGKSRVLITSRKPDEAWLNAGYTTLECKGLDKWDAAGLAEEILNRCGKSASEFRSDPAYPELIAHLNGHPRTMEVVLPLLRRKSPGTVLTELQQGESGTGRSFVDAAMAYAFDNLSEKTRLYLPLVGFFVTHIDVDLLELFCNDGEATCSTFFPDGFPDKSAWEGILSEAAQAGLLRHLDHDLYESHPALPGYLRSRIAERIGPKGLSSLDEAFVQLMAALSSNMFEPVRRGDTHARGVLAFHEPNVLRALRAATHTGQWSAAHANAQTIAEMYGTQGRFEERRACRRALLDVVGHDAPRDDQHRANLWMFLTGSEAIDALERNDLAFAEECYRRILDYLTQRGDEASLPNIAVSYHQLGRVAQERNDFDQAEIWYRKALEVYMSLNHPPLQVDTLAQMGRFHEIKGEPEEAVAWLTKAVSIALEYKMPVLNYIVVNLAGLLGDLGDERFAAAWSTALPNEAPPIEQLKEVLRRMAETKK